ncbi:class I SAM-dependent methyltransferase [Sphingomonas nostoxanthinifaciens]|uniref:class I SAM-dependent methyltransferase n=1 Tax=Sphingomonas nostoxanthinifaciens TaxID=2872652 RepID=UPI001CC1E396|nr:class I SAM-dependent methyltransferase [Sphingomonas nostoxanthinifaciens]UAK24491.1 class I SAM-dependent methyltransferase [Sphingomonas nostoxanthinifaciens]
MERHVYDRMAEIDRDHWWFVGRRRILTALLEKFRPKPGPMAILEVGAGTGSNIAMLQHFGTVDAIEPDDHARAFAEARTGLTLKGGYLPNVPLEDGRYDLIVLLDVLEHIPDDLGALEALRPKLAPGGRLFLAVPAMPSLWSGHDVAHHHQRRYTAKALRAVVRKAGYAPLHESHFNSLLLPAIVGVRWLNRLRGHEGGDEDAMPPRAVNGALARLFGWERYAAVRGLLPVGVSLALVAEPVGTTR